MALLDKLTGAQKKPKTKNKKNKDKKQSSKAKSSSKETKKKKIANSTKPAWSKNSSTKAIRVDVFQTADDVIVKADVSGLDPKDLDIEINEDTLTISGQTEALKEIEQEDFYYHERHWGEFSRSIILPVEIKRDEISAKLKNGLLTITLPKAEKEKTRKIEVEVE